MNIHTCPTTLADPSLFPCYKCDPLPAGSTEGCPSIDGNGIEDKPGVRYPVGCDVVFGEYYVPYYPNELKSSHCVYASWSPYW